MIISFDIIIKMLFCQFLYFAMKYASKLTLILNSSFRNFNYFKYLVDKATFETIALNIAWRENFFKK